MESKKIAQWNRKIIFQTVIYWVLVCSGQILAWPSTPASGKMGCTGTSALTGGSRAHRSSTPLSPSGGPSNWAPKRSLISEVVDKDRRHNNFQPHCQADDTRRVLFPALKLAGHSLCWASWRSGPHGGFIFFRDSRGTVTGWLLLFYVFAQVSQLTDVLGFKYVLFSSVMWESD